jgi:DNA (cytosine-5)-methyltransferase 1
MPEKELKFIDLFCGAGGLSEGLSEAGFHGLFSNEINSAYAQTYQRNHPSTNISISDIRQLDPNQIIKALGLEREELDLLAGGPPCQGFSINAPLRSILDERNHLFKDFLRFVDVFAPKAVLIENVPGLISFEDGETLHAILNSLAELGYGADVRILGAAYYGVPQMRWR